MGTSKQLQRKVRSWGKMSFSPKAAVHSRWWEQGPPGEYARAQTWDRKQVCQELGLELQGGLMLEAPGCHLKLCPKWMCEGLWGLPTACRTDSPSLPITTGLFPTGPGPPCSMPFPPVPFGGHLSALHQDLPPRSPLLPVSRSKGAWTRRGYSENRHSPEQGSMGKSRGGGIRWVFEELVLLSVISNAAYQGVHLKARNANTLPLHQRHLQPDDQGF